MTTVPVPLDVPVVTAPATVIAPILESDADRTTKPLSPTTTAEQDRSLRASEAEADRRTLAHEAELERRTQGQRRINLVWEYTQSAIASMIVLTTCIGIGVGLTSATTARLPSEWWTIVGLVIGFYFGRTNHTRIGGVGAAEAGR